MPEHYGDRLRITGKGPFGRNMKVEINGHELYGVTGLSLYLNPTDINTCTIEFRLDEIDIDAEALSELVAIVDNKRKREQHGKS